MEFAPEELVLLLQDLAFELAADSQALPGGVSAFETANRTVRTHLILKLFR